MEPTDPRAVRSREAMLAAATALLAEDGLEAVTHQTVAGFLMTGSAGHSCWTCAWLRCR